MPLIDTVMKSLVGFLAVVGMSAAIMEHADAGKPMWLVWMCARPAMENTIFQ